MAYPSEEYDGNFDNAIITSAKEVINTTPVGALFSARDIYSAYNADRDFDSTEPKSINLEESYAIGNTRASHFVGMEVDLDQKYHSTSSEMTIDCGVPGRAMAEFTVTFVPGGSVSPSQEHDLSYGDLDSMGEPDLAEYGIERITPGELRRGDYDDTLPDWKVREFLDRDGPVYITDFPMGLQAGGE